MFANRRISNSFAASIIAIALGIVGVAAELTLLDRQVAAPVNSALSTIVNTPPRAQFVEEMTIVAPSRPTKIASRH